MFNVKFTLLVALGVLLVCGQMANAQARGGRQGQNDRLAQLTQALSLTTDQQTKAKAILVSERQQTMQVLTADQQAQLKAQGPPQGRDPFKALNLTDEQKTKIQAIHQQSMQAMRAILTPDQQKKFDQMHAQMGQQGDARLAKLVQALTLTTDQQTKAQALFQSEQQQVQQVLTADQQAKLQQARKAGNGGGANPLSTLGLTDDQKAKIQAIHQQTMTAFRALLTADQQQKFDQLRANAGGKGPAGGQHQSNGKTPPAGKPAGGDDDDDE